MNITCTKVQYGSEMAAATAAVMHEGRRIEKIFWYKCDQCDMWHLTHAPRRYGQEEYFQNMKNDIVNKNLKITEAVEKSNKALMRKTRLDPRLVKQMRRDLIENGTTQEEFDAWNKNHMDCPIGKSDIASRLRRVKLMQEAMKNLYTS